MNLDDVKAFAAVGAAVVEGLWGGKEVRIGETNYAASVGETPVAGVFESGGEVIQGELLVQIRKELLATCPATDTRVVYAGKTYVIERTAGEAAWVPVWSLRCVPHN